MKKMKRNMKKAIAVIIAGSFVISSVNNNVYANAAKKAEATKNPSTTKNPVETNTPEITETPKATEAPTDIKTVIYGCYINQF